MPSTPRSLLITGAGGFIGSFLAEHALQAGFRVWVLLRRTTARTYLDLSRVGVLEADLTDEVALALALRNHVAQHGAFTYVIHAAGATKCRRSADFSRINTAGTLCLARLLVAERALTGRFVFLSSLSVMGSPLEAQPEAEITTALTPAPNTAYGRSKLAAEMGLRDIPGLDYIVLRPTGVYGPRERDYFLAAQSIARGIDFAVGYRPQHITYIYVRDLVAAAFLALERGVTGRAYLLSDGGVYTSRDFCREVQRCLPRRRVLRITAPVWVLRCVCAVSQAVAAMTGRTATLNLDKYNILKQRNWKCSIREAETDLGYRPAYPLSRGVEETIAWYKQQQWL